MTFPRYKAKSQKDNPSPVTPTSSHPTPSSSQRSTTTSSPASPLPPKSGSNASSPIDYLAEKIAVETRARETEAKLSKRIAELESEKNELVVENNRLKEEAYEIVSVDNTSGDSAKLEELLNEIKNLKESCQQHLEDLAQLEQQNGVLLQEKEVSNQDIARLDTHVQILAENLGLKEEETARLSDDLNRITGENSQLQEENHTLEKENNRLQEMVLFQPTTQKEEINVFKLQIEQLEEEISKLQEDNADILSNNKDLGEAVHKLQMDNSQLLSENNSLADIISKLEDNNAQLLSKGDSLVADISKLKQDNNQISLVKNTFTQEITKLEVDNAKMVANNNILAARNSELQRENDQIQSEKSRFIEEISKLQEENTRVLSNNNILSARISQLQQESGQILSEKDTFAEEVSKLREDNGQLLSDSNSLAVKISELHEQNVQFKNSFDEQISKLREDNAQLLSENNNLVEEIKHQERSAKILSHNSEMLQNENTQLLSKNTQLSGEKEELINQNKQLDYDHQHMQNKITQLEQRLKEEMNPFRHVYEKLSSEHNTSKTTQSFSNLHEIRPILAQFKDVNSNITPELQNDLGRLQKSLETFGSVKGAGKEIHIDQVGPLWHEYIDADFQTDHIPKNTLSAVLTRHIIETIFDGMANGIQDLEMTEDQDLEFRILTASDLLTDLIIHFCATREVAQETASEISLKIRQLVCSFVNKFGFKEEHPFVQSLAAKVQQQADRYRTLTKKHTNIEKLVRLAISVLYLQMRPLGVREVTFIETGNEYNESTMDDGDDSENSDRVEICWFPLILAEEPFDVQTLVTKAKVIYRESNEEAEVGSQGEGDIVYGRQWPLEIWTS